MNPSSPDHPRFSAVLLAGGQSRRMGFDKAAALFCGKPLWQHQIETMRSAGADELIVSGPPERPYSMPGLRTVADDHAGQGPLEGIAAALRAATHRFVLVLAVDMPFLQPPFLGRMVQEAMRSGFARIPGRPGAWEPLAAVYTRECLPICDRNLSSGERRAQRVAQQLIDTGLAMAQPLRVGEEAMYANVNTPEDLSRAVSRASVQAPVRNRSSE